jgi:hypothetical protein
MRAEEFKKLVEDAKLTTLSDWSCRFVVGLQINLGRDVHVESEAIEYQPAEFAGLTTERARSQIEMVRQRLVKAATEKLRIAQ